MSGRSVVTVVAVGVIAVAGCTTTERSSQPPDNSTSTSPAISATTPPLTAMFTAVLSRQAHALATRDRHSYLGGWDSSARAQRLAALTYLNLTRLGVAQITPRLDVTTPVEAGGGAWTAAVEVTWGLTGVDGAAAESDLVYRFTTQQGQLAIDAITPNGLARRPVWLLPGLVVRSGRTTLVAANNRATADRVSRLLADAKAAIEAVLPAWNGALVAYAPSTSARFNALLGVQPGQYSGIAAVTTTVDGSRRPGAATAIVLNPTVFGPLGAISAQVVVTHEATHEATDAATATMPSWVAEGFADYVGIGSVDISVAVAAKAALAAVRRQGAPATLPDDEAFDLSAGDLEATYEEAWLATSLIATTYGQGRLVAFYRMVEAHPDDVALAFVTVLHTTERAFTQQWRTHLEGLASAD